MHSTNFYLKDKNSKAPTLVYLFLSFDGKRLKYSTGKKILPTYWNADKQRARDVREFKERSEFNQFLRDLSGEVSRIYLTIINEGKRPTRAEIRDRLNEYTNKTKPRDGHTFFSYITKVKDDRAMDPAYTEATVKIYGTCINKLEEWSKAALGREMGFDDVNIDNLVSFKSYLLDQDYSNNYINKILVTLKVFLNLAADDDLIGEREFKKFYKRHMVQKEDVDNTYLSISDLRHLYSLDLSENKRLERVRDSMIIECFTGLRFSDFHRVKPEHFFKDDNGVLMLKIQMQKTKDVVVIPVHPWAREIMNRYDGNLPPTISAQKTNLYLKELCQVAGFNEPFVKTITKGGVEQTTTFERWEIIGTHTARRSYATNAFKNLVPSLLIMKVTGHKTEKQFLKYLKMDAEEAATIMAQSPFYEIKPEEEKEMVEKA